MADAKPRAEVSQSANHVPTSQGHSGEIGAPAQPGVPVRDSQAPTLQSEAPQWVLVGNESSMGLRTELRLRGRRITVLRARDASGQRQSWAAIDAVCYHAGGPLGPQGTLAYVGHRICLRCPWHSYLVDLRTGEGLYRDLNGSLCSKGVRQRVHEVEQRADGGVWVRLADARHDKIASDEYAFGPKHPAIACDYFDVPGLDW
jgi:nitrite reductase/ring-hydroxylating ferredoxin subunit